MASAQATDRRRRIRQLRSAARRPRSDTPVSIKIVHRHNRKMRADDGLGVESRLRLDRLRFIFERWQSVHLSRMVRAGELRWKAFSFQTWLLEVRCNWSEETMRPDEHAECRRWWLGLHIINKLEIIKTRRHFRV